MPVTATILARSEIAVRAVCLTPSSWLVLPLEELRDLVTKSILFRRAGVRRHASRLPAFVARISGGGMTHSHRSDMGGPVDIIVLLGVAAAGVIGMAIFVYTVEALIGSDRTRGEHD
ncbi:DUF5368 family protein [Paracoccus salsus]|uniref:DUF5368 family protein n=1 Tax=Paracoccus salsus TaxID=2911061 RepID=UPI001F33581C|nr:DUF5368 family protein [Paracoccus salsus]MCF3973209.1 DUF5368 domain-containing protein [Paracoccus salsus]